MCICADEGQGCEFRDVLTSCCICTCLDDLGLFGMETEMEIVLLVSYLFLATFVGVRIQPVLGFIRTPHDLIVFCAIPFVVE